MDSLVIKGLTKRFDSVVAVNEADLNVRAGEFLVIIGESACGKTTLLRLIAGLEKPDSLLSGLGPDLKVGWLIREGEFTTDNVARAAAAGFFQICPSATETNREMVASAHARLAEVRAHSVKGTTEMMHAIEAGCDGLTINWPDWLVHEDTVAGRSKHQGLDPALRCAKLN